jgi:hypothetical protein
MESEKVAEKIENFIDEQLRDFLREVGRAMDA